MAKIEVNVAKCKGCGLCLTACPFHLLEMSKEFNSFGNYYPIQNNPEKCIGCALCGVMCPDLCISVYKEQKGV